MATDGEFCGGAGGGAGVVWPSAAVTSMTANSPIAASGVNVLIVMPHR